MNDKDIDRFDCQCSSAQRSSSDPIHQPVQQRTACQAISNSPPSPAILPTKFKTTDLTFKDMYKSQSFIIKENSESWTACLHTNIFDLQSKVKLLKPKISPPERSDSWPV